jgi:hypothetical protein
MEFPNAFFANMFFLMHVALGNRFVKNVNSFKQALSVIQHTPS